MNLGNGCKSEDKFESTAMLARTNRWCTKSHPKRKQRELNLGMEIDSAEERHSLSKNLEGLTLMYSSAWYPM